MPTSASPLRPTCRSTSVILAVAGSAAQTRTPTDCCVSTSREELTSRVSPRATSTASPCGSINVRERPWASKPQPINYERCCTDRLNSHSGSGQRVRNVSWRYIARGRLSPLSFTRAWHGTALSSSMIGTFPREPRTASRQVYSQLQRNLLDERYIHEDTASGEVSGYLTVSEKIGKEQ